MKTLFTITLLLFTLFLQSQSIDEAEIRPDGILVPKVDHQLVNNPAEGMLVYDVNTNTFWYFDGAIWIDLEKTKIFDTDADTGVDVETTVDEDKIRFSINSLNSLTLEQNTTGDLLMNLSNHNGSFNSFLGFEAGLHNLSDPNQFGGYQNTFIGGLAGRDNSTGSNNTYIGVAAGNNRNAELNTFVGMAAGSSSGGVQMGGDENVAVGLQAGLGLVGMQNVYLGAFTGQNVNGSNNVLIGNGIGPPDSNFNLSHTLIIDGESKFIEDEPLIVGDFQADTLRINGSLHIRDLIQLTPVTSAPANPDKGMIYFNDLDNTLYVFNGTIWDPLN